MQSRAELRAAEQAVKNILSRKFRREEKCERKPSGCPFAFHNPPQRQNCKIIIQNSILQFWKQLGEKVQRDFFDKLRAAEKSVFRYASARSSQPRQTSTHAEKPEYSSSSGSVRAMALFGLPQAG